MYTPQEDSNWVEKITPEDEDDEDWFNDEEEDD